jgi:hypothetical protein
VDGVYNITLASGGIASTLCDMTAGGWTKVFTIPTTGGSGGPSPLVTTAVSTELLLQRKQFAKLSDADITALGGGGGGMFWIKCVSVADDTLAASFYVSNSKQHWDSRPWQESGLDWAVDVNRDGVADCVAMRKSGYGYTFSTYLEPQLTVECGSWTSTQHINWGSDGNGAGCYVSPAWGGTRGEVWVMPPKTLPPLPSPPSLVAAHFWPLTNQYGAADVLGGLNGTLAGAVSYTQAGSPVGGGLEFDGSSTFVQLPSFSLNGNAFSFSLWARIDTYGRWQEFLVFGTSTEVTSFGTISWTPTGDSTGAVPPFFTFPFSGQDAHTAEFYPLNLWTAGTWHHWAVTVGAQGSTTFYLDGKFVTSAVLGPPLSTTFTLNYFGRCPWDPPMYKGALANIRFFNFALSTTDVLSLFNARL